MSRFKQKISGLKLIPSRGGCFEIVVNGDLIYSKLATDEFPDEGAVLSEVESRLK